MKLPFSKWIVIYVFVLVTGFIIWCCYEMHRLGDLSPVSFIGGGIIGMLTIVIAAYMWRAKQSDLYELEKKRVQELGGKVGNRIPMVSDNGYSDYGNYDYVDQNWMGGDFNEGIDEIETYES